MSRQPVPFVSTLVLCALAIGCGSLKEAPVATQSVADAPTPSSEPVPAAEGKAERADVGDAVASVDAEVASVEEDRRQNRVMPGKKDKDAGARNGGPAVGGLSAVQAPPPIEPRAQDPSGETFKDYGLNGFTAASEDRLSTFAVDVDTASYTLTRRMLTTGYLPPHAAVRVEEFVNYFPYTYRPPADSDPFSVDVDAVPSPWDERVTLVRVGLQGKKIALDQRKPVHLTFLVDVSGSMRSADKLELVKKSLTMLTQELDDGDTVAIATYAGSNKVVLEPTPISDSRRILRSLNGLSAGGGTAMASGMELAYDLADQTFVAGHVNRVIVCSDGDANIGSTSHGDISARLKKYAQKGITLTSLGFGSGNTNDVMMERLANDGDGNYFYIDGEREARRVLVDKLGSTLEVIAKDVKIQVEWNPDLVEDYRLVGYENRDVADHQFRDDAVDAGEIGAGHQVTALYEVHLKRELTGDLAHIRLRAKAPGPEAPAVERAWAVPSGVVHTAFAEGDSDTRIAASAGFFADKLRGSPWMSEITYAQIAELARSASRVEYDEDRELVELIETASGLAGERALVRR